LDHQKKNLLYIAQWHRKKGFGEKKKKGGLKKRQKKRRTMKKFFATPLVSITGLTPEGQDKSSTKGKKSGMVLCKGKGLEVMDIFCFGGKSNRKEGFGKWGES